MTQILYFFWDGFSGAGAVAGVSGPIGILAYQFGESYLVSFEWG